MTLTANVLDEVLQKRGDRVSIWPLVLFFVLQTLILVARLWSV